MSEASKYNFPKAEKVQIFEQVDTYIETQHQHVTAPESQQDAAEQIQALLAQLRQKYPNATDEQLFQVLLQGFDTMPQRNPQNWQRWRDVLSVFFAGGIEASKVLLPEVGIPIEVGKRLYEIYDRHKKQLPEG